MMKRQGNINKRLLYIVSPVLMQFVHTGLDSTVTLAQSNFPDYQNATVVSGEWCESPKSYTSVISI